MDVVLQTQSGDPMLALRDVTWFTDGSGYYARLSVQSGGYRLDRPFAFDRAGLLEFLAALASMDQTLTGFAELRTPLEDDFIRLELSRRGSVYVTGESREAAELEQCLRFGFTTDQTVLAPFARDLEAAAWHDSFKDALAK
ncbi:MAG: hypothetical protein U0794_14450 [Isosphaeraceae bacterium]